MAGGTLAAWKLDEGLTVAEIRRRGGARLRFVDMATAVWRRGRRGKVGVFKGSDPGS